MVRNYVAQGAVIETRKHNGIVKRLIQIPQCNDAYATCRNEADRRLIDNGCRYCLPHGGCTINNSDDCNNLHTDLITACNSAAALCFNIGK